ncbi:M56 family metallopeptidase [Chitinophagaceae bacterium LB-8]|uniref:M56 family metallopeptidase n=1 Tax=Paraflavisolibacter caeni TaxID=2982496 RepID=A0A9X3BFL6_9BACT|nr:M56 family metallopeptidase [Paraflavisolibacter caeni]MCU7549159.1 M56 family metallopeptidase [Paraflavisolibacter caeni]
MPVISYSAFLQALGWAALNSIWQAGLIWCLLWIINYFIDPSPQKKYILSITCILVSFLLFFGNIFYFLNYNHHLFVSAIGSSNIKLSSEWLTIILNSASIAYLLLLLFPIYRLYENWYSLKELKLGGLQKVDFEKRLFVQKTAKLLGIKKEVTLFISEIIHSPVTIGFIKPIILLPIASFNHLSLPQAEAVLLHELAHIRRYDYLMNILICIAYTILYFNPFVKLFVRMAETSREESCDQMVLQFGYDKVSYASALLQLEKASIQHRVFTLAATGKSPLFQRIEKIAGLPSKNSSIRFSHFAGLLAIILIAFFFQALFTVSHFSNEGKPFVFSNFANPYYFISNEEKANELKNCNIPTKNIVNATRGMYKNHNYTTPHTVDQNITEETPSLPNNIIPIALNEVDAQLTNTEKKQVKSAIGLVKEVLITYEWKNLKNNIPDGLTEKEKKTAYREYLAEVKKINWKNLEQNLKVDYNNINWRKLEATLQNKLEINLQDTSGCENPGEVSEDYQVDSENDVNSELTTTDVEPKTSITAPIMPVNVPCKHDTLQVSKKKIIKL